MRQVTQRIVETTAECKTCKVRTSIADLDKQAEDLHREVIAKLRATTHCTHKVEIVL